MNSLTYRPTYRRHLPHIQPPGAILFVTFRLAGSLPRHMILALQEEAKHIETALEQITDPALRQKQAYDEHKRHFGRWDHALDANSEGPHWLKQPAIAQLIADSLHYRHNNVYDLDTFCIMSNHVHVLFTPLEKPDGTYHALQMIMQSLKRHTAQKANGLLNRRGTFWQDESYDHIVRSEAELNRIRQYILLNPVKAGLVSEWEKWPWTFCRTDWQSVLRRHT